MKPDLRVVEAAIESVRDIDSLLARVKAANLVDVMVLGYDDDGRFWTDVNFTDGPTAVYMLEKAKHRIIGQ